MGHVVEALYHDEDEYLKSVAVAAIMQIRGNAFVGVVLNNIVDNEQIEAWRYLQHPADPQRKPRPAWPP